jgi:hypothetical protein
MMHHSVFILLLYVTGIIYRDVSVIKMLLEVCIVCWCFTVSYYVSTLLAVLLHVPEKNVTISLFSSNHPLIPSFFIQHNHRISFF